MSERNPLKIKSNYKRLITLVAFFCFLTISPLSAFGQNTYNSSAINKELKDINNEISDQKSRINKIKAKQQKYATNIKQKQAEQATLGNQISIIENRVAKAELDIELTELEINQTKLEIQKTDTEIQTKNTEIENERKNMGTILRTLNKKDSIDSLEIILLNNSLTAFLNQVQYLEDISAEVEKGLEQIKEHKIELEKEKAVLRKQRDNLSKSKVQLKNKAKKLAAEKESKKYIIQQIGQTEKQYQSLLAQSKKEQQAAAAEIVDMEKRARAKMAELKGETLKFNDNGMVWPVKRNIITAYFHDPEYPFRHIFEHPAIDIRSGQGSPMYAVASGYVAKVKTGGATGYGYIMLIHGDGLSTVYGHASKMYVKQDEYVVQGQTIGLSGGLPGTSGAGRFTTGPHLHFEVRLNGIPVNPLNYLE